MYPTWEYSSELTVGRLMEESYRPLASLAEQEARRSALVRAATSTGTAEGPAATTFSLGKILRFFLRRSMARD